MGAVRGKTWNSATGRQNISGGVEREDAPALATWASAFVSQVAISAGASALSRSGTRCAQVSRFPRPDEIGFLMALSAPGAQTLPDEAWTGRALVPGLPAAPDDAMALRGPAYAHFGRGRPENPSNLDGLWSKWSGRFFLPSRAVLVQAKGLSVPEPYLFKGRRRTWCAKTLRAGEAEMSPEQGLGRSTWPPPWPHAPHPTQRLIPG